MKRTALIFFCITVYVLILSGCTQSSQAKRRVYGEVEATEIDVASRVPARVKRVLVKPGQKVKAGDLLLEFEDDVIAAKRKQAEAVIAAAQSKSNIAQDAVRPEEKEQLKAAVGAAKKQMDFAKISVDRARNAFKEGAISQQQLDEAEVKYQSLVENYRATVAKQKMAQVGARPEEKAGAEALLEQAKNALLEVDSYSKDISLTAPIDGEVFQILNREGELVPTGYPVITLIKTSDLWVTFNVPETALAKAFKMGSAVSVELPALKDKKIKASITYIAPLAGFATQVSTQDRGTFDLKTFEVHAQLPADLPEELRPGMTAIVSAEGKE